MDRKTLNTLIVDDNDLECECKTVDLTIDSINLSHVGFVANDLSKYDLIIYKGSKGTKILKIKNLG